MTRPSHRNARSLVSYWPHMGVLLGISLNAIGLVIPSPELIATGSNVLTISGFAIAQRHRNASRDDD